MERTNQLISYENELEYKKLVSEKFGLSNGYEQTQIIKYTDLVI